MDVVVWDSARTECTAATWSSPDPFHEGWSKLYVVRRGRAGYGVGRERAAPPMAELAPGRIWLIPGGRYHCHVCQGPMTLDWCHFTLADPDLDRRVAQLDGLASWPLAEVLPAGAPERLVADAAASQAGRLAAASLVLALLARLADPPAAGEDDLRQRLHPALHWIDYHFRQPLGIGDLARRVGLRPARFQQLFRSLTGTSVYDRILALRMQEAQRLLASTPATVREVAAQVGYSSPFHFTRAFTRRVGCSPSAWRDRRQGRGG